MEAIEFLKEAQRMCKSYADCKGCPLKSSACGLIRFIADRSNAEMRCAINVVEQWSKEHPAVTNAQKFVEVFGQHSMSDLTICEIRPSSHEIILKKSNWWNEPYEEPDHDT